MTDILLMVLVFAAAFIVGYLLISKVPQRLHTPLMSMTNAISAVTIIGALLLFSEEASPLSRTLGGLAVALATFNLVGGFAITHRMLKMFKSKRKDAC